MFWIIRFSHKAVRSCAMLVNWNRLVMYYLRCSWMAESAPENTSEIVRATPPAAASETVNNGVDSDTVSF